MNSAIDPGGIEPGHHVDGLEGSVDTGTIAWLLPEIVHAFDAATAALRSFRAGAAGVDRQDVDLAPLRVARSHLHQAHGALELGEIAGVTKLTEAIEELLAVFEVEPGRCDATALDAIIGGCRAIVEYLEDLQGGARQQPLHLFPSYRDLLVARGVDRIHPADLFMVDLGVRAPKGDEGTALDDQALREQRTAFEQALLRYLRNENDTTALAALSRAVTAIDGSVARNARHGQGQHRAFWWVTRALFEAMANGGFAQVSSQQAHIKRLAGRVNLQIRKLVDGSSAVTERLYTDTLFFLALSEPVTLHVRAVQERFGLHGSVPKSFETQRYGRVDPAALRTARESLIAAKAAWSAIVAGDVGQIRAFAREAGAVLEAVAPIKRRGLVQVAQIIDGIATDLGFDPRQPTPAVGLDVATALLFLEGSLERARWLDDAFDARAALVVARVEASVLGRANPPAAFDWLDRMSREAEERLTLATFVAELQANLRNAEKVLDGFFRDPAERAHLKDAQKSLAQASGALALLGHDDVHRAIDRARETIACFENDPALVDAAACEDLAQSLGAVGFYVEQIKRERIDTGAFHFDAVSGRFSADMARAPVVVANPALDVAIDEVPASAQVDFELPAVDAVEGFPLLHDPFAATDVAFAATQIVEPDGTLEDEIVRRAADAQDGVAALRQHPDDAQARERLMSALDDVRRNAMLIDDRSLQDEAAAILGSLRDGKHDPLGFASAAELADQVAELAIHANRSAGIAPPSIVPLEPALPMPSDDNVDAELLEIFLEEACGVLVDAEASMRVLDADPSNTTATANLRRGFHTLKGSGRMVGLMAFGDAAWSIEDTLNDHIANQRPASSDLRALVDYAIRYLAGWVDELRASGRSSRIPDALVEAARAVRQGSIGTPLPSLAGFDELDARAAGGKAPLPRAPANGDDFLATVFVPSGTTIADHFNFAATQVIDDEADIPALEFFGEQPELPSTDIAGASTPVAKPIESSVADTMNFEPVGFLQASAPAGSMEPDEAAVVHAFAGFEPVTADHVVDDLPVPVVPGIAASADPSAAALDLDFGVDEEAAIDEPVEAVVAYFDADEPKVSNANVVPFTLPQTVARNDDVRQIGSLTLSVALFNIYLTEADELLRVLTQDFAEWHHELDRFVSEGAMRAAHSLAGSSATVGLVPAHDLAGAIEDVLQSLWREPVVLREEQVGLLQDAVESLRRMLHRFAAERLPDPDPVRVAGLLALRREIAGDVALPAMPVAETPAEVHVAAESRTTLPFEPLDFGDAPRVASIDDDTAASPFTDLPYLEVDEAIELTPLDHDHEPEIVADASSSVVAADDDHGVFEAITTLGISETPVDADDADDVLEWLSADDDLLVDVGPAQTVASNDAPPSASAALPIPEEPTPQAAFEAASFGPEAFEPAPAIPLLDDADRLSEPRRAHVAELPSTLRDDIDPELLDIFVAEGGEILPQIGTLLRTWQNHPAEAAPSRMLLRHLHTLKGSARMAGAMRLGEAVHEIEARVESAARLTEVPAALLEELLAAHDRSLELFDRLQNPAAEAAPATDAAQAAVGGVAIERRAEERQRMDAEEHPAHSDAAPRAREQKQVSQQAVRVNSEVLDRLVNLAGEVSISRARIENEVLQIKGAMSDLNDNVERLRSQLREIELQAEFQMQSQMQSQQAAGQEREKFDPLEFDRFTRFQELTRMMAESVNDVKTLQQHLQKSLDSAETDLASQRRMTRDLQQDLMRVRMVPFASIAERLYRVARRTAKELDKRVNLDIRGGSVELDRSVLERMAGPFEHLLRNHIVHGVESRDARRAAGKDETGELLVEVRQEGNEVVLTFSDDGAGLDHDRLRSKGRELGLLDHDIGDAEAAELIFHPGFSTVSEVTELAGRGVGMDVVRAEAQVLAGRVSVDSESGKGTRFTINLPLTLAITQVVLVAVAGRVYALPAVLVEQVQQLRPQPLADAYRAGHLAWAGAQVRLAFLGTLLGIDDSVPVAQRSSPVLILRSAGERIAVHVDEVVGNQEVVVKNLGPQLARMTGIAGATVLGSGQIVLILNPVQLAQMTRSQALRDAAHEGAAAASATPPLVAAPGLDLKTLPTVMVVDDSLTVRRVTQRLLSREGYQVVLAKDGVDALEQLQDFPPDVMLVDIEMPRMDGFDLTRNVRNDDRFRHIPIIMITSRTADKHRQHAAQLGVDAYLGKPYQEDELLDLLTLHLGAKRRQTA